MAECTEFDYGMYPSKSTVYDSKVITKQVKSISEMKIVQLGLGLG
jgi:hypothetical protein